MSGGWKEETHGHLRQMLVDLGHASRKHGHSRTRTFQIWTSMRSRCDKEYQQNYKYYGGRGISYDPKWSDFLEFLADMGEAPDGMSLDRIDNSKGYCKENCRWLSHTDQCNNRRSNVFYEINGKRQTVAQWQREFGLKCRQSTYKKLLEMVLAQRKLQ